MLDNRQKIIKLVKKFDKLCKENNIWYSLDKETLLGGIRHGGFLPWVIKFQIMISLDGLNKLKRIFPNNIVDSSIDKKFKSLKVIWVENCKNWRQNQPFIEMRILVPTTVKQYLNYRNPLNSFIRLLKFKHDNLKHAINNLYKAKNEGYILIDHKRNSYYKYSWIQVLSMKTKIILFSGILVPIIEEYDIFLKNLFGENYLNKYKIPSKLYEYPAPLKEIEV